MSTPIRKTIAAALRKGIEQARAASKPAPHPHAYPWHNGNTASHHKGCLAGVIVPASYFDHGLRKADDYGVAHTQNEQAAVKGTSKLFHQHAAPFGTVDKSNPSVLKHYPLEGKDKDVDALIKHHGVQVYYMGGKHGRPDLANRNYNTRHLAIWDPSDQTTGDFGEASYQNNWRRLHELAHFLTYPEINQKYGEGRRMGSMGRHTSLREALRAVHWEDAAFRKQRELSKQIGVHIPDADFNREYNGGMADGIHRAIGGKFVDIQQEGLRPHSTHAVPLETSLGMVREAAKQMGLKGEHDLLGRP